MRYAVVGLLIAACTSRVEHQAEELRDEEQAMRKKQALEAEYRAAKQRSEQRTEHEKAAVPELLAKLAKDPDAMKPETTEKSGDVEHRIYKIAPFEHAELARVIGHPEAWSWMLMNPKAFELTDLGPAGAIHDLLEGQPPIGGIQIGGVINRIDKGPLAGAIAIDAQPGLTKDHAMQVGTIAYHQRTGSMMMSAFCDLGLVEGVPKDSGSTFKDQCFTAVAKQLGRPETELFPSPWMIRPGTSASCKHALSGTAGGKSYSCSDDSGKLAVKLTRSKP